MGIAIDRGMVKRVDDSIATYLPHLPRNGKEKIKIRDLLNMRSGLDPNDDDPASPGNETRLDASTDWIKSVSELPMRASPGKQYIYISSNAFLVGAIIENTSQSELDKFAFQNLFSPLEIARYKWRHVPIDRTTGQGNLEITTRDEAAVGQLFLEKGRYDHRQIVSPGWVEQCLASQVPISALDPHADYYGHMWYTKTESVGDRSILVHFASGKHLQCLQSALPPIAIPGNFAADAVASSALATAEKRSTRTMVRALRDSSHSEQSFTDCQ